MHVERAAYCLYNELEDDKTNLQLAILNWPLGWGCDDFYADRHGIVGVKENAQTEQGGKGRRCLLFIAEDLRLW